MDLKLKSLNKQYFCLCTKNNIYEVDTATTQQGRKVTLEIAFFITFNIQILKIGNKKEGKKV